MNAPSDLRSQLQSLKIDRHQRPIERAQPTQRRSGAWWKLLLVALLAAGSYAGWDYWKTHRANAAGAPAVRLIPVVARSGRPDPSPVLTATGKIVSDHKVLVFTKVSGQIVKLFFEQGDAVKAGQVMAEIEDVLFRARRDEAAANVERAKANLEYQRVNFERVKNLFDRGVSPQIEFVAAQRDFNAATAQLAADQAALDFMNKQLLDTKVLAPIAGVVLERNVNVGDFVAAEGGRGAMSNAQLGSIADMQLVRVEVDISELDIARLKKGMPCIITPDAYKDRNYKGYVMWIDPGANYSKATVQVKVRIENPDRYLRVEGVAQVAFYAERPKEGGAAESAETGIWIPRSACIADATGTTGRVFVAAEGRLRETTVKLGARAGEQVQVVSGLSAGQTIADEAAKLRDGERVGAS